jgi:RNA polymerase sigma factor (sigma-70 family)
MDLSTSSGGYKGVNPGQTPHVLAYVAKGSSIGITDETSDIVLVAAAKDGDHQAYAELCRRHSKTLLRTILRITRNVADAEDTLQEALLKGYVHIATFEGRSAFSSWLTRIAINSALMLSRKKRSQPLCSFESGPEADDVRFPEPIETSHNPEEYCIRNALEHELAQALQSLPPSLWVVIRIRCREDASVSQIAQRLGISESAAKSRLSKARSQIRRHLERNQCLRNEIDWKTLTAFQLLLAPSRPLSLERGHNSGIGTVARLCSTTGGTQSKS